LRFLEKIRILWDKQQTEKHLLDGVLDKQALIYCTKYCCTISLCETWQETCYTSMYRLLELTAMKDEVVFLPSESSNVLSKSFIHTGLWHNKNVQCFAIYIYALHTYIHFDIFSTSKTRGRVFTHIYQNARRHISSVNIF